MMLNGARAHSSGGAAGFPAECVTQAAPPRQPALDEAVNAIHDEVMRYYNGLDGLICRLEAPRPSNTGSGGDKAVPATIGEALQDIYNILSNTNEALQYTIKRIDEQVGELKLLP